MKILDIETAMDLLGVSLEDCTEKATEKRFKTKEYNCFKGRNDGNWLININGRGIPLTKFLIDENFYTIEQLKEKLKDEKFDFQNFKDKIETIDYYKRDKFINSILDIENLNEKYIKDECKRIFELDIDYSELIDKIIFFTQKNGLVLSNHLEDEDYFNVKYKDNYGWKNYSGTKADSGLYIMSPEKKTEKNKIIFLNYKNKLEEIS